MDKKKIYLAGGVCNWRDKIIPLLDNCILLDPRTAQDPSTGKNLLNWFELEINMINECDGLIAYVSKKNESGFGTTFEMGMVFALNKAYILINEKEDEYQWSMQTKGATMVFKTISEALQWINMTKWMNLKILNYE